MVSCPNCGTTVEEAAAYCPECGDAVAGGAGAEESPGGDDHLGEETQIQPQGEGSQEEEPRGGKPRQGQGGQGRPQGGQPRQGQGGQGHPQGGQPRQGQGGQGRPQGGQPRQGHQRGRGGEGGVSRRTLLAGGGVVAVAAGGFLAYTMFLGGGGPAGTVRSFFQAVNNGNIEQAEALVHPNSPEAGTISQGMSQAESMDISVTNTEVLEQTEEEATVEATISVGSGDFSGESTTTYVLRKHEGEWLLYSSG